MTLRRVTEATFIVAALVFAGCLGPDDKLETPEIPIEVAPGVTNESGELVFHNPVEWKPGDWWKATLRMDLGFDFLLEADGKIVAAPNRKGEGLVLASDNRDFGIIDSYFDSFFQGAVDSSLNPTVYSEKIVMYDWPVEAGKEWKTKFVSDEVFEFGLVNATLRTTTFEDQENGEGPRLRIQGETKGATIDYDYDPDLGWFTYFRLVNKTTGRIALSIDVTEHGQQLTGEIHALTVQVLYEAFKLSVPFSPELAPIPEVVDVPSGFSFLEYIRFVGIFPFVDDPPEAQMASAGAGAVTIVAPDATADSTITEGALEFHGEFERNQFDPYKPGKYEVVYALAGTSGAFVLIMGFQDEKFVL